MRKDGVVEGDSRFGGFDECFWVCVYVNGRGSVSGCDGVVVLLDWDKVVAELEVSISAREVVACDDCFGGAIGAD